MTRRESPHTALTTAAVVSAIVTCCVAADIRQERPRMLLDPGGVQALREKCRGPGRAMFEAMKGRADGMLDTAAALDNQGRFYLPTYALLYLITEDSRYADKAKEWFELLSRQTIEDSWTCLEYVPTSAAAYDWIHNTLTVDERARFAGGMIRQVERLKKLWRHSDYNNHFVLEHMSELHVALALAHEPHHRDTWQSWLVESEDWLKNHVIPAANEMAGDDGMHSEGFSYANWGYERPLSLLLLAWKTATGEDLFPTCTLLRQTGIWNLYGHRPDGTMCRSEDCPSGHRWNQGSKCTSAICAAQYRDGYAQWMYDQVAPKYPQVIWGHLLAWDPTVRSTPPDGLPLAKLFRRLGHVYTRSGWGEDATWAMFQCGDFFAGHQHLDNNSFVIYRGASLAIDSGVNEYSSHRANYYARSIAHNTILVHDPNEVFPNAVWSSQGTGGSNDGGQRRFGFPTRVTASADEKAARNVGDIVAYRNAPGYVYAVGDAARAYAPTKVKRFLRHFLHLRPSTFVVLDVVESTDPTFRKTWLLHMIEEPEVDGTHVTVHRNGSTLDAWTLLPRSARTAKVGGPGREYLVGGTNYPPDSKRDGEAGAWRVEISPTQPATTDLFLHVLHASEGEEGGPTEFGVIRQGSEIRTTFTLDDRTVELTLTTTSTLGGRLLVRQAGADGIDEALPNAVTMEVVR